jgi:hypothetical protein
VAERNKAEEQSSDTYAIFVRLLRERPLYDPAHITLSGAADLLIWIQSASVAFDAYCPSCKADTTWRAIPNANVSDNYIALHKARVARQTFFEPFVTVMRYLEFKCSRYAQHVIRFGIDVEISGGEEPRNIILTKFGQLPSLADIAGSEIDKYRQFITAGDIAELKRAVGLAAHGIGIGAFVYLRRVFERLVAEAADTAIAAGSALTRDEFDTMRMPDKLQAVRGYIPTWMVENRKLYGILSRGLHELSEETCRQAFPAVKQATIALLEQHAEEAQKRKRAEDAARELERLGKLLGGES